MPPHSKHAIATFAKQRQTTLSAIKPLQQGLSNSSFLVHFENSEWWVVKCAKGYVANGLRKEAKAYTLLQETDLNLDCFLQTKGTAAKQNCLFVKYIHGQAIHAWSNQVLNRLALALKKIHHISSPFAGNLLNPTKAELTPHLELQKQARLMRTQTKKETPRFERIFDHVLAILASNQTLFHEITEFSLLHGDLHYENLIIDSGGSLKLVDWERSQFGDSAFDLVLINWHGQDGLVDSDAQQQLLSLYAASQEERVTLASRVACWTLFRLVSDYLFLRRFNLLSDKYESFFLEIERLISQYFAVNRR
ncbi:aminoglycoside phosphotransferase family protein [Pseudoalteromonas xiamenensis]|uniref:aminoglycoside phosphotransferase family protein n=1 Tax=Pseudoalteromonas xiamenensis TaxID=882626 RepID=UPI0027E43E32|nr:aminoglycoside phosphotransferase family protein [Pseudoalteromonas xiamenensis]WMN60971.1 aminoglycoside phosphotransferase family protein [Pseudoalteromonas xiamenensis]